MTFKDVKEAFNHYNGTDLDTMQKRAAEIKAEIDGNPEADMEALNTELRGLKLARDNMEYRSQARENLKLFETAQKNEQRLEREAVLDTPEYRSAFFKTLLGRPLNDAETRAFKLGCECRDNAYNTSSNSAAVLPTQTLNEIIKKARTMGGLLSEARAFNVPVGISIPVGTPATKASWHTEAAAVESDNLTVSAVTFGGYEILKVFSISEKVNRMSVPAFESYIVEELRDTVLELLDYALVNGSGDGQGTGLESGITWVKTAGATKNDVEVAAATDLTYEHVVSVPALLKRGYAQGAKWAMNNSTLYNNFYSMVDNTGRPIFIADPKNESIGKILGFDVVIDDNIANGKAYLGNFSKYLGYNLPGGIAIESSRQSSFKNGVVDFRALAVADCKPIVADAFVRLHKKQS